ncbi:glycosyl transferase [Halarcobacter ebronensis]|uniref:Glycosyl transferase n=1 Tax=Halarcobacter ebronensis TaxID=1462615 RepID=A0A4Q0YJ45_9BACT|nr:glycosyltransferase [Halarcobacter ebronensis]RXJ69149.1 glycosyl transferase [Halarcobacter ebronensis]
MSFSIILANRLSKIIGNVSKVLICYPFHFFFPKKRFTIPEISKAKIKSDKKYKITKIIWQTNYSNRSSLPVYLNYLFNRLLSLDFEYRYVSTEARLEYIEKNGTKEQFEAFKKLTDGAAQADFWRVFTLLKEGGVYLDIDAHFVWPLSKIIKPEDEEVFLMTKHNYSNYFIASAPGNKYLKKTLDLIVENIEQKKIGNGVYDLTGPTVLNLAIGEDKVNSRHNKITCVQGSFTNEYFQYIDKPRGKWTHAKKEELLND